MNKQIEELIATIEITKELCDRCCDICKMHGKGCMPERMAKKLAQKGYRRAEDVALEVFEYLEEKGLLNIEVWAIQDVKAELKKKYTESEKDNGN